MVPPEQTARDLLMGITYSVVDRLLGRPASQTSDDTQILQQSLRTVHI